MARMLPLCHKRSHFASYIIYGNALAPAFWKPTLAPLARGEIPIANIKSKPVWGPYQTTGGIVNYQHLHFQFPAKPFQRWHVIEDRTVPRGLRFRHARQPGEKPDPKVNFGVEELSARLERAGVE
jgi:hypothetical protein